MCGFRWLNDRRPGSRRTILLVWTTTPWTLPSNQFAAVHPELEYAVVERSGDRGSAADHGRGAGRNDRGKVKRELKVERTIQGSELVGRRMCRRFDYYYKTRRQRARARLQSRRRQQYVPWRVVAGRFRHHRQRHRRRASGAGVRRSRLRSAAWTSKHRFATGEGPQLICAVGPDGKFTAEAPDYQGRWVKDADKDISRELRHRGLLYHQEQYLHEYPFCWRAEEDPLIQYPRKSWFIRTTAIQRRDAEQQPADQLAAGAHSRRPVRQLSGIERRLGPVARALLGHAAADLGLRSRPAIAEAVGSYDDLLAKPGVAGTEVWDEAKQKNPELSDHLKVHKPYIDAITYDRAARRAAGTRMRRVPDVIDCWYDSGAMPFAQWGYPHQGPAKNSASNFPADFISEAIDQTRGWFYSLLAISTLLFRDPEAGDAPKQARHDRLAGEGAADPVSQLHRARTDARRRRPENVEEQAELLASRAKFSTATGPMPCAGTSSPTSRRGPRSATANRRSRTAFPSFCCGCGTSTASS